MAPSLIASGGPNASAELCWAFAKASFYHPRLFDAMCKHHLKNAMQWEPLSASKLLWAQVVMAQAYPALTNVALKVVHAGRHQLPADTVAPVLHSLASLALVSDLKLNDEQFQARFDYTSHQGSMIFHMQVFLHLIIWSS
jgi:hypothetical protein